MSSLPTIQQQNDLKYDKLDPKAYVETLEKHIFVLECMYEVEPQVSKRLIIINRMRNLQDHIIFKMYPAIQEKLSSPPTKKKRIKKYRYSKHKK